jgi:general secretion pathway protein D
VVKTSTSTIDSPTINQRKIATRIVVQDGETIGLGGLIKDSDSISNSGVPWLTDIPVLGTLFGTRDRSGSRTELLIMLTPHVIQDQRTVRELTEDLRAKLGGLAAAPIRRDPIEPSGPLRP